MEQEAIRKPVGLDAIFLRRLNELREECGWQYKEGIMPFRVVFKKVCRNFSITKQECWQVLFLMRDMGFIEVIAMRGVRVIQTNLKIYIILKTIYSVKLLKELRDEDYPNNKSNIKIREASRAVLIDNKGLTPILFVAKHHYHKLPGGEIDKGEDKKEALVREVLEELGSEIKIDVEIGKIIEYRSKANFNWECDLKQISYCYLGEIISKGVPQFIESEMIEEFELVWMPLEEAIKTMENDKPANFEGSFIRDRDLTFLKAAQKIIKVK